MSDQLNRNLTDNRRMPLSFCPPGCRPAEAIRFINRGEIWQREANLAKLHVDRCTDETMNDNFIKNATDMHL